MGELIVTNSVTRKRGRPAGSGKTIGLVRHKDVIKSRLETDLLFLARFLGYTYDVKRREGINDPPDYVHQRMALLDKRSERFHMGLYHRFSYKTTVRTICKSIQRFLQDFDNTIMIVNEVWDNSRKMLSEIKWHLETNEQLIALYGKFRGRKDWGRNYINIRQRSGTSIKEPSISTAGVDSEVTSCHPRYIILDDLVGPKNITTFEQKQKVIDYIDQVIPMVGNMGHVDISGTRWAYDDAYDYLIKKWLPQKDWDGNNLFAYDCMAIEDEYGVPTMPSKFGCAEIKQMKDTMPAFLFACQMLNNPVAEGNTLINPKDVKLYQEVKFGDKYEVYITVDPAISLNPKRCWTGITCCIPMEPNLLYVDEAIRKQLLPQDLINELMMLVAKYEGHVRGIGIENTAFQMIYNATLSNELRQRLYEQPESRLVPVRELKPVDNKHKRIYALEPYFRRHQIFIREGLSDLLYQLYHYPQVSDAYLDLMDALAYQLQMLPPWALRDTSGIIDMRKNPNLTSSGSSIQDLVSMPSYTGVNVW